MVSSQGRALRVMSDNLDNWTLVRSSISHDGKLLIL